jgi:GDP-L-fucose synthase
MEEDVWKTFPSPNDRFAGWAKRMGELQAEAYRIEYGWEHICIVRPANVYGPFDNFDPANAMVIPSLIRRALDGENPLVVWGDGSQIRDFIHARDVAAAMIKVMEKGYNLPVNIGSGQETSIRDLVEVIVRHMPVKPEVIWDTTKPQGDRKRLMDVSRMTSLGFRPAVTLEAGIRETMEWYLANKADVGKRYNVFVNS